MSGRDPLNEAEDEVKKQSGSGATMAPNQESIEDKIEGNERRIASLTEELRKRLSSKEKRIVGLEDKIEALEKEIQELKDENKMLVEQLQKMKDEKEIQDGKIEKLEKDNEDQKAHIYLQESVFIILQIGTKTQRNMCKFVLGEHFKEYYFYKFKDIDKYIVEDLEHPDDQDAARERLKEVKEKIPWNQRLVDSLKNLNHMRIGMAHPDLNNENIQQATSYLKGRNILKKEMVDNVNKLKEKLESSEALLQRSSAEVQDQGNVPTKRQKNGTYASKASSGRAKTRAPPPKWERGSRSK